VFFLTYIRNELRRRAGRTVLTVLGLALGVGLVAAITSVSNGLDEAQRDVLNPLASVGTDLMVTRPVATATPSPAAGTPEEGPGGFGFGRFGGARAAISAEDQAALIKENQSVITDLSKLGDAGDKFVHTYFLPATQLTFPAEQAADVAKIEGVAAVGTGLTLLAVHQEGTVPEIVAEIQTGGETITVEQNVSPPTTAERKVMEECFDKQRKSGKSPRDAFGECMPERLLRFRGSVNVPERTIRQALNPPETDITSETYTIAGVDLAKPDLGLITESQLTAGKFLSANGTAEGVLSDAYAQRQGIAVGHTLDLNGTKITVVGFAKPPLGGQAADVYIPLDTLQKLSARKGRVNVLLVRAADAGTVKGLSADIASAFPGAQVTSAEDVAARVSGSLVDAAGLADRLGTMLSTVLLIAAFLIASLLTLSSVSKRVRELGTLKAIGWSKGLVVRQVVGESLAQGALGGIIGIGLGIVTALAIAAFAPPLQASAASTTSTGAIFGLGQVSTAATDTIALRAPIDASLLMLAFGLALLGGLVSGAVGALRAARLRPADALREIG